MLDTNPAIHPQPDAGGNVVIHAGRGLASAWGWCIWIRSSAICWWRAFNTRRCFSLGRKLMNVTTCRPGIADRTRHRDLSHENRPGAIELLAQRCGRRPCRAVLNLVHRIFLARKMRPSGAAAHRRTVLDWGISSDHFHFPIGEPVCTPGADRQGSAADSNRTQTMIM